MSSNLKIYAFAGIIYLVSTLPEITLEVLHQIYEISNLSSFFLKLTYLICILSAIFFYSGFIILAKKLKNDRLQLGAWLFIFTSIFYYIFSWYTLGLPNPEWEFVGGLLLIFYGFSGIVFGWGLYQISDVLGKISSMTGILEIIIGISFITVILFVLGLLLSIPAVILEILILFKATEILKNSQDNGKPPTIPGT